MSSSLRCRCFPSRPPHVARTACAPKYVTCLLLVSSCWASTRALFPHICPASSAEGIRQKRATARRPATQIQLCTLLLDMLRAGCSDLIALTLQFLRTRPCLSPRLPSRLTYGRGKPFALTSRGPQQPTPALTSHVWQRNPLALTFRGPQQNNDALSYHGRFAGSHVS
jgi:hypothetical protein